MENPARTDIELHELIKRRWSPRAFSGHPVGKEKLMSILESARWAPSCFNAQPWHFMVATRKEKTEFGKILSCLAEANQVWAKNASVLIISVAKLRFRHNDKDNGWAIHDIGLAAGNMAIEAMSHGIFMHQMAGFDPGKAVETFNIPEGYKPVTAIALGYPGDSDSLPDDLKERELAKRERRPLSDFVFSGRWGEAASFIDKN